MTEQTVTLRIDLIRDAIKELGIHWSAIAEAGMYSLKVVRGVKEKLEKYWPEVTTAGKPEDDGTFMMFVDFPDVHYYVKWRKLDGFVEVDYPEECSLEKAEEPIPEKNEIAKAFDTLKAAMTSDPGYLWSWVCNVACPIMDSGVEHGKANKAAARLLAHLFKVDVTEMPEYKDIIARTSKEINPEQGSADADANTIHVTVTGFEGQSGAEALARHIHDSLVTAGQYSAKLNIADTTLVESERSLRLPKKANTLIYVTGVESRYHTDRVGETVEGADDSTEADLCTDMGECGFCGHPECPDCYASDSDGPDFGGEDPDCGTDVDPETKGKLTINLTVDKDDLSPITTIEYFRSAYPAADMNVEVRPDLVLTNEIAKQAKEAEKKTLHITLGDDVEDAERVIDSIRQAWHATLPPVEEQPTLANPEYRKNAYVFERDEGEDKAIMVLHVDVDAEEFHPELLVGNGVRIVQMPDIEAMHKLLERVSPAAMEYYVDLFSNNERWLNRFGDGTEVIVHEHVGPFTLYNLPQDSIPKTIYSEVEDCWTAFQNIGRLGELADKLNDPTILIRMEEYLSVTRGGLMVVREHPRLEELFLKYLHFKAQFDPCIGRWLRSCGK